MKVIVMGEVVEENAELPQDPNIGFHFAQEVILSREVIDRASQWIDPENYKQYGLYTYLHAAALKAFQSLKVGEYEIVGKVFKWSFKVSRSGELPILVAISRV